MPISKQVASQNFAAYVSRVLNRARGRGMTDKRIAEATGVTPTTFHRWRRGEWGAEWPKIDQVMRFVEGLGEDPVEAFGALGAIERRTAQPAIDPDALYLLRRLADPNVAAEEKQFIRVTLRGLTVSSAQLSAEQDGDERRAG